LKLTKYKKISLGGISNNYASDTQLSNFTFYFLALKLGSHKQLQPYNQC